MERDLPPPPAPFADKSTGPERRNYVGLQLPGTAPTLDGIYDEVHDGVALSEKRTSFLSSSRRTVCGLVRMGSRSLPVRPLVSQDLVEFHDDDNQQDEEDNGHTQEYEP